MSLYTTLGAALYTQIGIKGATGSGSPSFLDISGLRGTPELGSEANIFDIPQYNSSIAASGVGQANLPPLEIELNYKPGDVVHQVLPHLAGIVQTAGDAGDVATVTESDSSTTQTFTPGAVIQVAFQLSQSRNATDVAVFTFSAVVGNWKTNPDLEDQTIATLSLALQGAPVGPSGTAITFDTPESVAFA